MNAKHIARYGDENSSGPPARPAALPLLGRKKVLMGMAASMGVAIANTAQSPAAVAAGASTYIPQWAPSTAYVLGQQVVSPNNDVVSAKAAHTSTTAYAMDTPKWKVSSTFLAGKKTGKTGSVAINTQGDDAAVGPLNESTPANGEMRFVLERLNNDPQAGTHRWFIIEPYTYGMSMSYGGLIQMNTACLAVGPMVQATGVTSVLGAGWPGGIILAINEVDDGGLFLTSKNGSAMPGSRNNQIIAETYTFADGGPIEFVTRGASGFAFKTGTADAETKHSFTDSTGKWFFRSTSPQTYAPATVNITAPVNQTSLAVFRNANPSTADIFTVMNSAATAFVSVAADGGLHPGNSGAAPYTVGGALWAGTGAPANGLGAIGDVYFRSDTPSTANQRIYAKTAAAVWTGIL